MKQFIPVNTPTLGDREKDYLIDCINSGWISSDGPYVTQFEEAFAKRVGCKFGVAVTNGTAALELSVRALGIGEGDEVIIPTFTIISCALAVVRCGASVVLVDSEPYTWNMDVCAIEACITPRTKAIMAVHIYGLPVDMREITKIAKKHGLFIIEDAAEAIGLSLEGEPCGSFGDLSSFSFYANKHVTTGEGGMVCTNNPDIAEKARYYRNLCFGSRRFVHEDLGWNFRMTNVQAAIGLAQLERLEETIDRKRVMGKRYQAAFESLSSVQLPLDKTSSAENCYWVFGIVLADEFGDNADKVIAQLLEKGIGCRPFFWPMHLQPVFQQVGMFLDSKFPVAERLARRGFYIPSGLGLSDDNIDTVINAVMEILE